MPIIIRHSGQTRVLEAPRGAAPLSRFLWEEGILIPHGACLGLGRCGRCRVRFLADAPEACGVERGVFSDAELAGGARLACRHMARDGMDVEIAGQASMDREIADQVAQPSFGPSPRFYEGRDVRRGVHLAVDVGTTSIAWRAERIAWRAERVTDGEMCAEGQFPNPQFGADVMSRLSGDAATLRLQGERVRECLRDLVRHLAENGMETHDMALAANPAMTALILDADVSGLRAAPYYLPPELSALRDGEGIASVPGLPPLWIAPPIGPFIGGDVSAGLALLDTAPRPFLLADMGTNGEFVLAGGHGKPLLTASVPLGPALEGIGMRHGGPAGPGAVLAFHPGPKGLEAVTWENGPARHIAGTGYLSRLHALRSMGVLDADGLLGARKGPLAALGDRLLASIERDGNGAWLLPLPGDLALSGEDVEKLLEVKAAFSLAVERLLEEAGLQAQDLTAVYLAGALGLHAPLEALESLGFLSGQLVRKTRLLGNSSLAGAALLLRNGPERWKLAARWAREADVLDLASEPSFQERYVRHMTWGKK